MPRYPHPDVDVFTVDDRDDARTEAAIQEHLDLHGNGRSVRSLVIAKGNPRPIDPRISVPTLRCIVVWEHTP